MRQLSNFLTSPTKRRGLKPNAEQGASSSTRSKLLGENPLDFSTLPPAV